MFLHHEQVPDMPSNSPGLDFQTAALAAGLVSGLTFLIGQARNYLDRAVSDAQEAAKWQDADLQKARKDNEIYLTGRVTLARYASAPGLPGLLAQTARGLLHRPLPPKSRISRSQRAAYADPNQGSFDVRAALGNLQRRYKRSRTHLPNEPTGIAISLLILLVRSCYSVDRTQRATRNFFFFGWTPISESKKSSQHSSRLPTLARPDLEFRAC